MSDLLRELLHLLDSPQGYYTQLQRYATGRQPLAFLSPASRKALDDRLVRMSVNIPALAVSALTERLRVTGFSDPAVFDLFTATDLDQLVGQVHTDALTYGQGFVLVWAKNGKPVASVESPFQCAVLRDPADGSVIAGVKRFSDKDSTHAYVYLADRVDHYRAPQTGAAVSGFVLVDSVEHNLGQVPLVCFDNHRSEIDDLRDLTDALVKVTLDMVVASHAAGFGRRWVTGVELVEMPVLDSDGNPVMGPDGEPATTTTTPFDESATSWAIAENTETTFGSFAEANLSGFETAVRVLVSQIQAVSALPSHYLGVLQNQPTSADALRASEASLTARAESKQLLFGRAWEQVGRLLLAVQTNTDTTDTPLRVQWADAATRSTAQEVDAAVKLVQAGLPWSWVLKRLNYSDDQITEIRAAMRAEALDKQGVNLDLGEDT
ncbi:phage portal protein [Mycolicibacterium sp. 120266]|uniref:phage portal protein n=1 Tax=Mycolicibacterium sp. 120266 TaxID=3090601 RepID=UPI00299CFF68|nr:phage portal protein [Mycolicibacterium sp. 120266]MDX1873988.1 phage portal protein [Mycolicibacterium sp. 120266]